MKRIVPVMFLFGLLGCGKPAKKPTEVVPVDIPADEVDLSPEGVKALKDAVRAICLPNIDRLDNLPEVRAQLDPLVNRLAIHYGRRLAVSKVLLLAGAWREIWTDQPYPMNGVSSMDYRQIYQVVSPWGHYWNLSDSKLFGFIPTTGALRGKYALNGTQIEVEFTTVGFRFGHLDKNADLVELAQNLEAKKVGVTGIPGGGMAPRGPVGIQGSLETLYVDEDLRIDIGQQYDFVGPDGKVAVPGVRDRLFVLERVRKPVK